MRPEFKIGKRAIKIILLKTQVGKERHIYNEFKNNFKKAGLKNWWGYEILGDYDLCFILEKNSLDRILINAGSIDGIIHSTELLCWAWDSGQTLSTVFKNKPLICLNILKLKPPCLKDKDIKIDKAFAEVITNNGTLCLGTFGWSEFILIRACKNFHQAHSFITQTLSIYKPEDNRKISLFLKSLTLVGVACSRFYPKQNLSSFNKEKITEALYPNLSISCRPSEMTHIVKEIGNVMIKSKPKTFPCIGETDLTIQFSKEKLYWGDFIGEFYAFRNSMLQKLIRTNLSLAGNFKNRLSGFTMTWQFSPIGVVIEEEDVEKIKSRGLLSPAWETILSTFYTFNSYLQNELLADSMLDMMDYVIHLKQLCTEDQRKEHNILEMIADMPKQIRYGSDQRLSGYMLAEGTEDFSPFKGGKHRLLKALKAVCFNMFQLLGMRWPGFVIIGNYDFEHDTNIISIPANTIFNVESYFGLFHECGHVYILKNAEFTENEIQSNEFKKLFTEGEAAEEIFSDLIAFECGFLGYYELYRTTMINYFSQIIKGSLQNDSTDHKFILGKMEEYLVRLLSVALYHKEIIQSHDTRRTEKEITEDLLQSFELQIGKGEKIIKNKKVRSEFLNKILYTTYIMKSAREKFSEIYEKSFKQNCRGRKDIFESGKFQKQFKMVKAGMIVSDLEHPQLIVLKMLQDAAAGKRISYRSNAAAIQSFLDFYYSADIDGDYFPYEKRIGSALP